MNTELHSEDSQEAVAFPFVSIRFFDDLSGGLRCRYVYRNPHHDIQSGDVVQVPVGLMGWRKKRAYVVELLTEPPHQGRLTSVGALIDSTDMQRSERFKQRRKGH